MILVMPNKKALFLNQTLSSTTSNLRRSKGPGQGHLICNLVRNKAQNFDIEAFLPESTNLKKPSRSGDNVILR